MVSARAAMKIASNITARRSHWDFAFRSAASHNAPHV
jgi:hypothetical protein